MELSLFLNNLLSEGKVSVNGQFVPFEQHDIEVTEQILQQYYQDDVKEMPGAAPEYSAGAALWAAQYIYAAIQLIVLRDAREEVIAEKLKPFSGKVNASSIYSADLVLRYILGLLNLAKGLAPADLLVKELNHTALQWPFSSVGIELEEPINDDIIFRNPSLKYAYLDRIIRQRDKKRITNITMEKYICELTGEHISILWPDFESNFKII